ncbi:hypothetical protein RvY_02308-2 [Ramazzottius varieornatus]|uniref:Uncharacterized protein n=1 Tax=Ramazzottius varieornatus TaxID=947166 RepID=A0A1D1UJA2_RAMVA|nr:hypothetical protein RvY_02308-2 [Ramazzottius varieornatus]
MEKTRTEEILPLLPETRRHLSVKPLSRQSVPGTVALNYLQAIVLSVNLNEHTVSLHDAFILVFHDKFPEQSIQWKIQSNRCFGQNFGFAKPGKQLRQLCREDRSLKPHETISPVEQS